MQYIISHTFNDFFVMPFSLKVALFSEKRFKKKDEIIVFYTPPRSPEIFYSLKDHCTIYNVENITKPFTTNAKYRGSWYSYYGEKIHAARIVSPNVLFMDCDILMVHDPEFIWDDDFDLAVAPMTPTMKLMQNDNEFMKRWNAMFKKYNKKVIPHFEAPIMFFKDNVLSEIANEYITLMDEDIPPVLDFYDKEQMVLALTMSDKKVKYLTYNEIGDFRYRKEPFWNNIKDWEKEEFPIIWHIGIKGLGIDKYD